MKTLPILSLTSCAFLATSLLPATAADADQLLQQMSKKLAGAKSLSFTARRKVDAALIQNGNMPKKARVAVSIQRPNKFAANSVSKLGTRHFIADGRTLTVADEKKNTYATVPMRTSIDGLVISLDEKYGFTPPLIEFAMSDVYKELRRQARSVSYVGVDKSPKGFLGLGGVKCHRIALRGKVADAEIWIALSDQLPRKLVATFKGRPGAPKLTITFADWNLNAPLTDKEFTFAPTAGDEKIEMWTTARMQSAAKKSKSN